MKYEFRGKSLHEAIQKATRNPVSTKQIAEVWAPPSFWGPWFEIEEIWTRSDADAYISVSFDTISNASSTFEVELAHGQNKYDLGLAIGPGSTTVVIPRNVVTALFIRAKAHGIIGQSIDVNVSGAPAPQKTAETHYIWRTKRDNKVRSSHVVNEGQVFAWDSPPPTGHPGEDYNCRCIAEPYLPEKI